VAATPRGVVVGTAWIDACRGDSRRGHLGLLVVPQYQNVGIEHSLLVLLIARARESGFTTLTACVFHDLRDARQLFLEAGLDVLSSLAMGGVSEVVLKIQPPSPGAAEV